jgi:hypothetical protein
MSHKSPRPLGTSFRLELPHFPMDELFAQSKCDHMYMIEIAAGKLADFSVVGGALSFCRR